MIMNAVTDINQYFNNLISCSHSFSDRSVLVDMATGRETDAFTVLPNVCQANPARLTTFLFVPKHKQDAESF